jgi:Transport and Golgi organisation 2
MCTVTFLPGKEGLTVTSNRDEKWGRGPGLYPAVYGLGSGLALFPKDAALGGTWFAVHQNGNVMVLLNGAWTKHSPRGGYRRSRGLVLLDLLDQLDPVAEFVTLDLSDIEPFTLVLLAGDSLQECRWDGRDRFRQILPARLPHIWSSVTLYDDGQTARRRQLFDQWLLLYPEAGQQEILDFHRQVRYENSSPRTAEGADDQVGTVSITSLILTDQLAAMKFQDLVSGQTMDSHLTLLQAIPAK